MLKETKIVQILTKLTYFFQREAEKEKNQLGASYKSEP